MNNIDATPLLATWKAEADALKAGNHPKRRHVSKILTLREEVTLRACILDVETMIAKAGRTTRRAITASELGQLQALNNPELADPDCPDLEPDTGAAFDFKIGFFAARMKMKQQAPQLSRFEQAATEAREALERYDAEAQRSPATAPRLMRHEAAALMAKGAQTLTRTTRRQV